MSIRLRLTLWYTTVLAVVLVLFGAALYYLLTFTLINSIDRQLETTARRVAQSARIRPSVRLLDTYIELPEVDNFNATGVYIQVYDVNRREIVDRSSTLGDAMLPLDEALITATVRGESQQKTVSIGDTRLRVHTRPIIVDDQVQGIIQVGTPLRQVDQTQRQLLSILVVGGVLAIAVSAALGALLARAALQPVDQITQTALAISRAEDLSRRLDAKGPADEVSRLAATFNEMLSRLEGLFHTQRRFIADVSHELRTPLTTIQGNVELLGRDDVVEDREARREAMQAIEGEVARMSRLVADLLLLAQADAGLQLRPRPIELDTLLLDVYRQARVMSNGVEIRMGQEDQARVLGDPDRLRQLFLNLLENALKYTPPGGRVTLSLTQDPEWVRVSVSDTGIGIPPEHLRLGPSGQPLIFERFYRADKARSRVLGGTGLGLSIASWIAQAHGGRITVESSIGQGSTFVIWLPAAQASPPSPS